MASLKSLVHAGEGALVPWLVVTLLGFAGATKATAGTGGRLDLSFNGTGTVLTHFGSSTAPQTNSQATAIAIQSDGKIVAAGFSSEPSIGRIALARYLVAGSLDSSFGDGGKVFTDYNPDAFGALNNQIYGLGIQSDGKIVVAGGKAGRFALFRFNTDGSFDSSFGDGGGVLTDFGGSSSRDAIALGLAIQSDGKIVLAGTHSDAVNNFASVASFAVARYNTDGSLDSSFGGGGTVVTNFSDGNSSDEAAALAIQSDGKIVVAGSSVSLLNGGQAFVLARYDSSGSLDSSFGRNGLVVTDVQAFDEQEAHALAVQSDGKIVVAGVVAQTIAHGGANAAAVVRYNADGSLDSSFGAGSEVFTNFNSVFGPVSLNIATAVAIQSDGKIVVAGDPDARSLITDDFALARYNTDGSPDSCTTLISTVSVASKCFGALGSQGTVLVQFGGDLGLPVCPGENCDVADKARALAIQSDGKIVVAGGALGVGGGSFDFGIARFLTDVSTMFAPPINTVNGFNVNQSTKNSLLNTLTDAVDAANVDDIATTLTELSDFNGKVQNYSGKQLTTDQATQLLLVTQPITLGLGGSPPALLGP